MDLPKLGLDIDAEYFAACLVLSERRHARKFKNCPSGFKELWQWLLKLGVTRVLACMEATGRYGDRLAEFLYELQNVVAMINPAFICAHKAALNRQNKTDPGDAFACGDYARCFPDKLILWAPKSKEHQALIDVAGQLELLKKTRTAFSNRGLCGINSEAVKESIKETLQHLDQQIEKMEELRDQLYEQLPALKEVKTIVDSVPGIGEEIADALASRVNMNNFRNGRDLAAFLGIASREWNSGKQKRRGKQTKVGNKRLRTLIRMGATSALNSKYSYYKEFAERLRHRGLSEGQIITAVARKMLLIAHALFRKRQLFDCCYLHDLAKAA